MKRLTRHDADGRAPRRTSAKGRKAGLGTLVLATSGILAIWAFERDSAAAARSASQSPGSSDVGTSTAPRKIEETRLTLNKWIETQQILSKERNEWAQGKEILAGRIELVEREIAALQDKIKSTVEAVNDSNKKRDGFLAQKESLEGTTAQLTLAVADMESEVKKLFPSLPAPIQEKLQPLRQRIPEDASQTKASVAERFQNVLGILNEVNKANSEIAVTFEVHELSSGKPSEVQAIYVGLAQAYYHSPNGEAGIGRPTPTGWRWEPSKALGGDVFTALEILQGKHTPAFVPLPVKLQ